MEKEKEHYNSFDKTPFPKGTHERQTDWIHSYFFYNWVMLMLSILNVGKDFEVPLSSVNY